LSAGLLRQATYSTCRLGIYTSLFERFSGPNGETPGFLTKLGIAVSSGIIGSFVGTPSEVCLIRMTSDGRLPIGERRNYTNVFNALLRIFREEGLIALWRGAVPTMGRAAVVNGAQLASYSQAKQYIIGSVRYDEHNRLSLLHLPSSLADVIHQGFLSDGIVAHFSASMFSGFVTSVFSLPVDITKTRIQNMRIVDGKPEYRNMLDVFVRVVQNEGILALWKGFTPYFLRIGPHTVLTFIFLEQLSRGYRRIVLGDLNERRGGGL
uniref:UCP5 protein n=1 Tax=Echinostoma caproni TaxID=27848 RepID=A0A183A845_9TREM